MINKLSKQIHQNNIKKGFFENEKNIGEMLALIHSEVSEALECDRKNRYVNDDIKRYTKEFYPENEDNLFKIEFENFIKDTFEDELADIMIRVMDLAAFKKINLEDHIFAKMRYNSLREYKHGKKY